MISDDKSGMVRPYSLGVAICVAILVVDLASKILMEAWLLRSGQLVEFLPFLDLRLGYNTGVSFSLLSSQSLLMPWLLAAFAVAVSAYLYLRLRRTKSDLEATWNGLIMGGALGNAIDRLIDGAVTDFLDIHVGAFHWPTFNVADVAIVLGVGLALWVAFAADQKS